MPGTEFRIWTLRTVKYCNHCLSCGVLASTENSQMHSFILGSALTELYPQSHSTLTHKDIGQRRRNIIVFLARISRVNKITAYGSNISNIMSLSDHYQQNSNTLKGTKNAAMDTAEALNNRWLIRNYFSRRMAHRYAAAVALNSRRNLPRPICP